MAKILIIEDEAGLADAYTFLFRHQGHTVACAHNGEDGLVKVKRVNPDLIVLDMMMPKLDGLGFLRGYKAEKHPKVKIILLSNMQSREYETEAFALGVSRYEIKALLSPPQLVAIVNELLRP